MKRFAGLILLLAVTMAACTDDVAIVRVSQTLGATGGVVSAPSGSSIAGASVNIPAGALTADATVTVNSISGPSATVTGFTAVGPVVEITVLDSANASVTLASPATVTVPFNAAQAGSSTVVMYKQSGTATPEALTVTATTAGTVSAQVTSFSRFWAMVAAATNPNTLTVTAVVPPTGPAAGGTQVAITGTGFSTTGTTTVEFGGVAATNVTVVSETSITCTTPAGANGPVPVTITSGGKTGSLTAGYLYNSVVVITINSVTPASGSEAGGTNVTLGGSGFATGQTSNPNRVITVTFGIGPNAFATNITPIAGNTLICSSPPGTGTVTITVTITDGATVLATGAKVDAFTYLPAGVQTFGNWFGQSTTNAPGARFEHGMCQVSGTVYVFGGRNFSTAPQAQSDGAGYVPTTDTWTALPTTGAPSGRYWHQMVTVGTKFYVFGGNSDTQPGMRPDSASYDPSTTSWSAMSMTGAPAEIDASVAETSPGTRIFVWGRTAQNAPDLYAYDTANDTWSTLATGHGFTNGAGAVGQTVLAHTGTEVIVYYNTTGEGARYHVANQSWTAMSTTGGPGTRTYPASGYYGNRLIIWGGDNNNAAGGAMYDPSNDTWTAMSTTNAPDPGNRSQAAVTGSGAGFFIWGGTYGSTSGLVAANNGWWFLPSTNTWEQAKVDTNIQPTARWGATAVYVGRIVIFGGQGNGGQAVGVGATLVR